jgi:hypothetical protein
MIPKRSPRIVALLIAGTLVGALFASPALAAKPVKPGGTAVAVPETVGPSTADAKNYARFDVTFTNTRNSSLQQVTIEAATPAGSDLEAVVAGPLVNGVSQGTCNADGTNLSCTIGTVVAGASVTLSVVYEIPVTTAASMNVSFIFKSTGAPGTDPGTSHGDDFPVNGSVVIDSTDFDGGYLFDPADLVVETNQVITKRGNPQSTRIFGPESGIPVTASEVAANQAPFNCPEVDDSGDPVECFGQWSVVNVNNGFDYSTEGGFLVVIGYDQVPGNSGNVGFVHLVGAGSTFITESCTSATDVDCIVSVDSVSSDLFYTLRIGDNGPIRGI